MAKERDVASIGPTPPGLGAALTELWAYRALWWTLGLRDLKLRFKQTRLGLLWALLRPAAATAVFVAVFTLTGAAKSASDPGRPYVLVVLAAMLPWQFFATVAGGAAGSLLASQTLVRKAYFPRMVLPLTALLPAAADLAAGLLLLAGLMVWHGAWPGPGLWALPAATLLLAIAAAAAGLWLSAMNALWRDVGHAVPFALQLGAFVCPVAYEAALVVPWAYRPWYDLNPLVAVIETYRWALLSAPPPALATCACGALASLAALLSGVLVFRKLDQYLADAV